MSKILIVAAHPDDEVLGCGGTIAKYAKSLHTVHVLFMSTGCGARKGMDTKRRVAEAKTAANLLGITVCRWAGFPDNEFDTVSRLVLAQTIEESIRIDAPEVIYTHTYHDINIDHQRTNEATLIATRPVNGCPVRVVYGFEVASATEWQYNHRFWPTVYVDIGDVWERKLQALKAYESELRGEEHPRSLTGIEVMARARGQTVGLKYAEAFELIREIK